MQSLITESHGKGESIMMTRGRIPNYLCATALKHISLMRNPKMCFGLTTFPIPIFPWFFRGGRVHLPIYSPFITSLSGVKRNRWAKHWTNCSPRESRNVSTARGGAVFKASYSTRHWPGFIVVSPKIPISHLVDSIVSLLCTFDIHKIHKGCNTTLWPSLPQHFNTFHSPIPREEQQHKTEKITHTRLYSRGCDNCVRRHW